MIKLDRNVNLFMIEKFPEYNLSENLAWLQEKTQSYTDDYSIQNAFSAFILAKGDRYQAIANLFPAYVEVKEFFEKKEIRDQKLILVIFFYLNLSGGYGSTPEVYYNFYQRKTFYKDQNEEMKTYYGLLNEEQNFLRLVISRGNIREAVRNIDNNAIFNKELLQLNNEGFTNEAKNRELVKDLSWDTTYNDIYAVLKVNYDDKLLQDFKKMKEYGVYICKHSLDTFLNNNQDWIITTLQLEYSDYLELYKDIVSPEILLYSTEYRLCLDYFIECISRKIEYFKSKGVTLTEGDMIKLLAYVRNIRDDDEKHFNFYQNMDSYLQKNEEIKKKFPHLNNDFKNMKALEAGTGDVGYALEGILGIDRTIVYSDEIKTLKEMPGFGQLSDELIAEKIIQYRYNGISQNWDNIIYCLKFYAEPDKLHFIEDWQYPPYNNHKEFYEVLEKHQWNEFWRNIFSRYRNVYEAYKDKAKDGKALFEACENFYGNLEKIREIFE